MCFWREHARGHRNQTRSSGRKNQKMERKHDQDDMGEPVARDEICCRTSYNSNFS